MTEPPFQYVEVYGIGLLWIVGSCSRPCGPGSPDGRHDFGLNVSSHVGFCKPASNVQWPLTDATKLCIVGVQCISADITGYRHGVVFLGIEPGAHQDLWVSPNHLLLIARIIILFAVSSLKHVCSSPFSLYLPMFLTTFVPNYFFQERKFFTADFTFTLRPPL